jgi:hypothetical protein
VVRFQLSLDSSVSKFIQTIGEYCTIQVIANRSTNTVGTFTDTWLDSKVGGLLSRICETARPFLEDAQECKNRYPRVQSFNLETCELTNINVLGFVIEGRWISFMNVVQAINMDGLRKPKQISELIVKNSTRSLLYQQFCKLPVLGHTMYHADICFHVRLCLISKTQI